MTTTRVIVTLMIKNESAIIKRCIQNALSIADAICITDTGSTDDTVELLTAYLPTLPVPAKLYETVWKNFGESRTESYQNACKFCSDLTWDLKSTYGLLLDADMNLVVTPEFSKRELQGSGYQLKQKCPSLEYYNTRFVQLSAKWKCVGVTHEYWDGQNSGQIETVYIDDVNDGGCKADKFTRDEMLLRKGLEDEPDNVRYMFYLGQTLKDLGKFDESIQMYMRRINAGGWFEEIWYSMFQICKIHAHRENLTEMEYWGNKAFEYRNCRAEPIYQLTKKFREKGLHFKAWHYLQLGIGIPKPSDILFVEHQVYTHLFHYEETILSFYVMPHKAAENLLKIVRYYNKHQTSYFNLQFYVQKLESLTVTPLSFPDQGDFKAGSTSIVALPDKRSILMNVRYHNFELTSDGNYIMRENGKLSTSHTVRTENYLVEAGSVFDARGKTPVKMSETFPKALTTQHVQGFEDLRMFADGDTIKWIANSREHHVDGKVRQVMGVYDSFAKQLKNLRVLNSPTNSDCEKNWIGLGRDRFIYKWSPYQVGRVTSDNDLCIETSQDMPHLSIFNHVRGSSNVYLYEGFHYAVVHIVVFVGDKKRKYYHMFVKLNEDASRVVAYSMPFYFVENNVEYVLGLHIDQDGIATVLVSQNDINPVAVSVAVKSIAFESII